MANEAGRALHEGVQGILGQVSVPAAVGDS